MNPNHLLSDYEPTLKQLNALSELCLDEPIVSDRHEDIQEACDIHSKYGQEAFSYLILSFARLERSLSLDIYLPITTPDNTKLIHLGSHHNVDLKFFQLSTSDLLTCISRMILGSPYHQLGHRWIDVLPVIIDEDGRSKDLYSGLYNILKVVGRNLNTENNEINLAVTGGYLHLAGTDAKGNSVEKQWLIRPHYQHD